MDGYLKIKPEEPEGYSVIFPDLNGVATCGQDLNEAVAMAVDCLAGYLYTAQLDNENIPAPSSMEDISVKQIANRLNFNYSDAFIRPISVDVNSYAKNYFLKQTVRLG